MTVNGKRDHKSSSCYTLREALNAEMVILRVERPRPPSRITTKSRVGARHAASLLPTLAGQTLSAGLRDYLLPPKHVRKDGRQRSPER